MHSCCGKASSLPSLWSGRVPGLVQDSLARPQAVTQELSDPLAKDWEEEAKCLPWLFSTIGQVVESEVPRTAYNFQGVKRQLH